MKTSNVFLLIFLLFVLGWMSRVLVPYYQQQHDQPMELQTKAEANALMDAIYEFAEQNPEKRFPINLPEVSTVLFSIHPDIATNLNHLCEKFVYKQPPPLDLKTNAIDKTVSVEERDHYQFRKGVEDKVVLVEKLGHYKYREGGYITSVGRVTEWHFLKSYTRLIETNGFSISQMRQQQ